MYQKYPSFFRNCVNLAIAFSIALTIAFTSYTSSAKADIIYQAFDMCYQDIKAQLPKLKSEGYTYIQVSPPQTTPTRTSSPCKGDDQWWYQYQPINYNIGNTLGSESELKDLIATAHSQKLKILVDVVLNHLADEAYIQKLENDPQLQAKVGKPLFALSEEYFHKKDGLCDNSRYLVTRGWLGLIYENGSCQGQPTQITPEILPDLKTESQEVRDKAKQFIEKLVLDLGADGLRFDAIKHIEPEFFEYILKDIPHQKFAPDAKYVYGEIIDGNAKAGYIYDYINKGLDVTDYPLEIKMVQAFRYGGDLRSLINPQNSGVALPGLNAVTFARTHDTAFDPNRPRDLCLIPTDKPSNICFSDSGDPQNEKDTFLGIAYVLSLQEGFPLVYGYDAENPTVLAGVKFHETLIGQPQYFRNGYEIADSADSPNLLFIERGGKALTIINKAATTFDVKTAKMPGLEVGCYKELQYDFEMCVAKGGDGQKYITQWGSPQRGGINIGPRSALFFIKTEA
jgi:alpha-amylase